MIVLGAGGWWVVKTRAQAAEKARIAAEQKAEAERQTEARKRAEEEEKARVAAEQKAEQERVEKLTATVRTRIAELRIAWDALEQQARQLERKLSELKSEERSLNSSLRGESSPELLQLRAEIAAHEELSAWLNQQLLRHPAKVARVQGEELLSARQVDDSAATIGRAAEEQAKLEAELEENRKTLLTLTGTVTLRTGIAGVKWTLTDAWGRKHTGEGGIANRAMPIGPLEVEFTAAGFKSRTQRATIRRGQAQTVEAGFKPARVTIDSYPAGAEVWLKDRRLGVTPMNEHPFTPGTFELEVRLQDYPARKLNFTLEEGDERREEALLLRSDSGVAGFAFEHDSLGFDVNTGETVWGVRVKEVTAGGPADRAGIRAGEYILSVSRGDSEVLDVGKMANGLAFSAAMAGRGGEVRILSVANAEGDDGSGTYAQREVRLELVTLEEIMKPSRPPAPVPVSVDTRPARVTIYYPQTATLFSASYQGKIGWSTAPGTRQELVSLKDKQYYTASFPPGETVFTWDEFLGGYASIRVVLLPGQDHYLKASSGLEQRFAVSTQQEFESAGGTNLNLVPGNRPDFSLRSITLSAASRAGTATSLRSAAERAVAAAAAASPYAGLTDEQVRARLVQAFARMRDLPIFSQNRDFMTQLSAMEANLQSLPRENLEQLLTNFEKALVPMSEAGPR